MKKASFLGLMFSALSMAFVACSDEAPFQSGDGTGRLAIRLDVNTSAITSRPQTRAIVNGDTLKAEDLYLKSTAIDGSNWEKDWGKVSEFYENYEDSGLVVTVPRGTHLVEAYFGNDSVEGVGKPYIYGCQKVAIDAGKTEVGIVAELQSAIFSFNLEEGLKDILDDYNIEIVTNKGNQIEYTAANSNEDARAYVMPGQTVIYFKTQTKERADGSDALSGAVKIGEVDAQKRYHYIVSVRASSESTPGKPMIQVTFDDSFQLADEITIDLSDDALTIQPEVVPAGFNSDDMVTVVSGSAPDALDFNIIAMSGIDQVTIETQNWSGILDYWADKINLVGDDVSKYANSGLETKGLGANRDKMAIVRLSGLLKNAMKATPDGQELIFTVTATSKDITSEPVTLKVKVVDQTVVLSKVDGATLHRGNNAGYQLMLEYNGNNPAEDLILQYHAENGWTDIADVTYTPSSEEGKYIAQFDMNVTRLYDPTLSQCEFRFRKNRVTIVEIGNTLIVKDILPSESFRIEPYDIYAKYGYFKVTEYYTVNGKDIDLRNSADIAEINGNYKTEVVTIDGEDYIKLTGLEPATEYTIEASLIGGTATQTATFTTEAATQLPNSGMEDWCTTSSGKNWELYYPSATESECAWGTNNPMTTSQGKDYGYTRISGTKPTDNGHTGKAACISTQGWGSGNSAVGTVEGTAVCKYIDAGLLHLGSSRTTRPSDYSDRSGSLNTNDLDCGLTFESRPSALSFWFKYEAKNHSDKGFATVSVYDNEGNIIASGSYDLVAQSTYENVKIPLIYTIGGKKASKIYICYMSTSLTDALTKSNTWINAPNFGNLKRGEYYGSRLYIDDIELIY